MSPTRTGRLLVLFTTVSFVWLSSTRAQKNAAKLLPENVAKKATVTATHEYSAQYRAQNVIDGDIPAADCRDDAGRAWCVRGSEANDAVELRFAWNEPVSISDLLCFGRTAFSMRECWRDYQLLINGNTEVVAEGRFEMDDRPQRISLGKTRTVHRLVLKFANSHGGPNPGLSEVMAFGEPVDEKMVTRLMGWNEEYPDWMPGGWDRMLVIQRNELNPSHVYTYHAEGYRPGGGLYLFTPAPEGPHLEQMIDSTDGQILDCALSYDGREILFSWKRGGRPYQDQFDRTLAPDDNPDHMYRIYRMDVNGTGLTCLTGGLSNNFNPCWLPDGDIAFLSDRKSAFAYCFTTTSPVLYRMDRDGNHVQRLSANYLNDFTPSVGPDGRILYSRWEYVDRPAIPIQSLWSINPDGTGLSGVFGNRVLSPATFMEAKGIPGTNLLLCVLTSHNGPCRGAIGTIDRRMGPNAQDAIRNLTPEINIGQVDQGSGNSVRGPYENPLPLDEEFFLVSKRGAIVLRNYEGTKEAVLLRPRQRMGFYSPTPIRSQPTPPVIPSTLPHPKVTDPWASVSLENVYVGLEPHVRRGTIKRVCVVQEIEKSRFAPQDFSVVHDTTGRFARKIPAFGYQFPVVSCGATYAPKKVWGFAKVEEDGSAHFKVPSGVPIYFMALDEEGRALQRMRSFTHLMPGEQQGCVGCHADRNSAISQRGSDPTNDPPTATTRPPQELEVPEWGLGGFSYARIVQPVLDRHCVECHHARDLQGGVDLSGDYTDFFNVSYDILARKGVIGQWQFEQLGIGEYPLGENPYTSWISTYNQTESNILEVTPKAWGSPASLLADLILSGHPDDHGKPRIHLGANDKQRVFTWIDLNVPYYGTSESNYYDRKGCRRLYPRDLDAVLADVAQRRCASCHAEGIPRTHYTRILNPEENSFLFAPLAKTAGGTERCGRPVFASTQDPDYQKILASFAPLLRMADQTPRMDMPGAHSSCDLKLTEAGG
ncbi:MAG: hypothetical protein ACC628_01410 [Pirellulaceae bacterium]